MTKLTGEPEGKDGHLVSNAVGVDVQGLCGDWCPTCHLLGLAPIHELVGDRYPWGPMLGAGIGTQPHLSGIGTLLGCLWQRMASAGIGALLKGEGRQVRGCCRHVES